MSRGIVLVCRGCGCTNTTPCILMRGGHQIGTCSWVAESGARRPLCSACVPGSASVGQLGLPGVRGSQSATWARFKRAHSAAAFEGKVRA